MDGEQVILGRLSGLFGVRGALKVFSYTEPRDNIGKYAEWAIRVDGEWRQYRPLECRPHGRTIVARLDGVEDRDQAALLLGAEIGVSRDALPPVDAGQFYWTDLVGLEVRTTGAVSLGRIERLFATGANDVLVVSGESRERWLPFVMDRVVRDVDLVAGTMEVDWDPEW